MVVHTFVIQHIVICFSGVARVWRYGGHRGSGGRKAPSGVQEQSHSGDLGAKPPETRYAYTTCSEQMHFLDVFIEDI